MKVLVTRTDRLGDLVLSLPVFGWLNRARPDWELHAMVAPGAVPLVQHHPGIARVWTWTDRDDHAGLAEELNAVGFDAAVLLQYRRQLARLLRRAGIPRRYGPRSKLTSWFLLNRGVRQQRSRSRRHELDYNLELVQRLAPEADTLADGHPGLYLSEEQRRRGERFRAEQAPDARRVVFVHPGSGGSALDWEPQRFAEVANGLARKDGWRVFVTGSEADRAVLDGVRPLLTPEVAVLAGRYDLPEFMGVLSGGDLMVGPSTGPLHIAAALGLAAVGLYPPVATMSPRRWGPRGPWVRTLEPPVACPARRVCTENRCPHYNCMTGIGTEEVLATANDLARAREVGS